MAENGCRVKGFSRDWLARGISQCDSNFCENSLLFQAASQPNRNLFQEFIPPGGREEFSTAIQQSTNRCQNGGIPLPIKIEATITKRNNETCHIGKQSIQLTDSLSPCSRTLRTDPIEVIIYCVTYSSRSQSLSIALLAAPLLALPSFLVHSTERLLSVSSALHSTKSHKSFPFN